MADLHANYPGASRSPSACCLKMRSCLRAIRGWRSLTIVAALCVFFRGFGAEGRFRIRPHGIPGASTSLSTRALGCPAQYCDDGRVAAFQRVAQPRPGAGRTTRRRRASLDALRRRDGRRTGRRMPRKLLEARAEVAAAVDCFTMRPDAEEGRYLFLDVGAGTLDGACFKLYREAGPDCQGDTCWRHLPWRRWGLRWWRSAWVPRRNCQNAAMSQASDAAAVSKAALCRTLIWGPGVAGSAVFVGKLA